MSEIQIELWTVIKSTMKYQPYQGILYHEYIAQGHKGQRDIWVDKGNKSMDVYIQGQRDINKEGMI